MGLKFRRGSTAQQSGSLAFGEPYVNTTLGTLVVGGATGDIVLSSAGTGSTGNFGAISGSGLDITGNANIAGNLTLGGAITIGDASADTVNVVASLSSSLIPSVTNAFDLGSETKIWRDLYISTGSIKFVGTGGAIVGTLSNSGNGMSLDGGVITRGDSTFGTSSLAVTSVTGSLRVSGSNSFIGTQNITGSIIPGATDTYDLGSPTKQWKDLYLSSGSLYIDGTQVLSSNATELIFTTDTGQSIKFNELGTDNIILQTVDGDIELKSSGGGDILLDPTTGLVSVRGTLQMQDGNKITSSGGTNIVFANDVIVSGSITTTGNINGVNLSTFSSSINTTIKSKLDADGVISGSSQITLSSTTGFSAYSTSVDSRITTEKGRVDAILSASSADKDSFAEIVTLINSVDLTNDTAFASFYTASVGRLNNLESTSGSVNISVSNLNTFSGSALTRLSALEVETANLETFSSSALTRLDNLEGKDFSITLTGDVTGTGTVTNLSNVSFATTVAANSVALGTDTTGDYVASLVAGTNITLSNNSGEGATPTIGLTNNSTTIGTTAIALGASSTTLAGLTSVTSTAFVGALTGNASTVTTNANLTGNVTSVGNATTIAAGVVTDAMLAGSISNAKLTNSAVTIGSTSISLGSSATTIAGLTSVTSTGFTGALTGNASTATTLATARNINGVSFNGSADITVTAAAGTLSGATLSSGVTASSLTSVGTLTSLTVSGATATGALTVTGAITATGDITAFYTSDKRHKNNIKTIPNALEKVTKLNGVTWEWNDDVNEVTKSTPKTGLIAQEVQEVLPEVVKTRDDGFLALDYSKMMGLLVEAIKEQQIQIEELKAQIGSK